MQYLQNIFQVGQPILSGIGHWVFPHLCNGCGQHLTESSPFLCISCLRSLEHPSTEVIQAHLQSQWRSEARLKTGFSLWMFDAGGTVQKLQHALKYRNRPRIGRYIGSLLGNHLLEMAGDWKADILVPVPLSRLRQLERGYNQSAELAKGMSQVLGLNVEEGNLVRSRSTTSQTKLDAQSRWANVSGAFVVSRPEEIAGKRILLVDDILTTGATLAAAAVPLFEAGASEVRIATMAVVR